MAESGMGDYIIKSMCASVVIGAMFFAAFYALNYSPSASLLIMAIITTSVFIYTMHLFIKRETYAYQIGPKEEPEPIPAPKELK